ncbi:MAG TPA: hypothetical protein VGB11_00150 [Candidatus Bathyarchaeia archaeon]
MKKTRIAICVLLGLLVFSTAQSISISAVSANNVIPAVFCPNNFQPGNDTENEITLARATCTYIRNLLTSEYGGCYFSFDEDCTWNRYTSILWTLKTYGDQSVVFSKGHRGVPFWNWTPPSNNHFSLIDHNGVNVIDNYHIYPFTSSENAVTFIWHCQTAQKYPEGITPDYYGVYGMPYCWTHNPSMQPWGASGIQVFLGWVGQSPQFETIAEGGCNYANVAGSFWYYVCNGAQIDTALNTIAQNIFGDQGYLQCPQLKDKLLVYGNRTLTLPVEW